MTHIVERPRYSSPHTPSSIYVFTLPLSLSLCICMYICMHACVGVHRHRAISVGAIDYSASLSLSPIARMYASTSSSSAPLGATLGYRAAYRRYIAETRLVSLPCELCGVAAEGTTCAHDRTKRLPIPTARPISSGLANSACLRVNVCMGGREPFDERVALLRCEGAMLFWRDRDRARKGCLL